MGVVRLHRFSRPEVLKAIRPESLVRLLLPHATYFRGRGLEVQSSDPFYCDLLAGILADPDENTPSDLIRTLQLIDGFATKEGIDDLIEIAQQDPRWGSLTFDDDSTPADVLLQTWLAAEDLVENLNDRHVLAAKRSYEYFPAARPTAPGFVVPSPAQLRSLEVDLDEQFAILHRGRQVRVQVFPDSGGAAFLVRHGDPFRREGKLGADGSSTVTYRPEKYDVLRYYQRMDELAINADSKKIKTIYRECFGRHAFGNSDLFSGNGRYTLDPLKEDARASLACTDIPGMECAVLTELRYFWGGKYGETEVRKARDLLGAMEARNARIREGDHPLITSATFEVVFTDSKAKRKVTVRPPSVANYTRDSDAEVIGDWLLARGFVHRGAR